MRRHPIGRLVVGALLAAALLPAAAQAQVIIKANDPVFLRLGAQIQAWADWTQDATTRGYAQNLYIRRARVLLTGQVAPDVTFFIQTDNPNVRKAPKALTSGFILHDAPPASKIAAAFAPGAGESPV